MFQYVAMLSCGLKWNGLFASGWNVGTSNQEGRCHLTNPRSHNQESRPCGKPGLCCLVSLQFTLTSRGPAALVNCTRRVVFICTSRQLCPILNFPWVGV
jgi:hypothetical protein